MRRFRVSGYLTGSMAVVAAAALMLAMAATGNRGSRGLKQVGQASTGSHLQLLQAKNAPAPGIGAPKSASVIERYRQFPLSFEPNRQQTSSEVKFLARGDGYILFLTDNDAVFRLANAPGKSSVLRMSFQGANANPRFTGVDELPGKSNYFIGNQPGQWRTNIPNYRKVTERGVYPGIDLVYYGTQRQLEYDFVLAPGARPDKLHIAFQGAEKVRTDGNGDVVVSVAGNDLVRLHKPVAYQKRGSQRQLVAANYVLLGQDSIAFEIGDYDTSRELIVDPILSYSTYLGGSGIDAANAIAVAPDNTAFVVGSTSSSDFPTIHALQPNDGGNPDFPEDAFVSKISADGSTLLYSTYLGGTNRDAANGIAVDNFGDAFVIGTTLSPNYPVTTNSFNTLCGADGKCGASYDGGTLVTNAFVTKLNPAGSALVYSTFYGYFENVSGEAIAVDPNGNAYLTGYTTANFVPTVTIVPPQVPPPPFPITSGAFQTTYGGGATNAYVAKLDATGSTALYSSYLGGGVEDAGYGIALDSAANAYLTGLTYSPDFPTTTGALQQTFGGAGDAFVAKVNMNVVGTTGLVFSTYLGGSGLDQGNGIAVDASENAYVTGLSNSATFGFGPNGFQKTNAGEGDAFVAKLTPVGALSYFTFLGGSHFDEGTGIAVDSTGNAYLTGTTVSTDLPTAGAVFQPVYGGGNADSFVAKLDQSGNLVYSSYLGGTNTELAGGIAVDTSGNAYVTGQTCSEDFPLANPLQAVPGGNCDAYVAKISVLNGFAFNPAGLVFAAQSLNTTSQPQTVTLTNGDTSYAILGIALAGNNPGDFAETTTCPTGSLNVGATCTLTVTFTPTAQGIRKASLTINDNAPGNPHIINLTGNTSTVTLSTSSLAFGTQPVGTSSSPQDVTVTNSGTTPLAFSSIVASGDFSESDNCTKAPLQPNTNCVIAVTFTPSAGIASLGSITISDNGSGSPQEILTTGTGVPQTSTLSLSASSLTFGNQAVGTSSAPQGITVTNSGTTPLTISSVAASGNFSEQDTCTRAPLQPSTNCVIAVTFTPTAAVTSLGAITLTDNGAGSPQVVSATGVGVQQSGSAPTVTLSPSTLTFGPQTVGTSSAPQNIVVTNSGTTSLTISTITASGNFSEQDTCTRAPLQPSTNCVIAVTFTPTAGVTSLGAITLTDNGAGSPQIVSVTGSGTQQASFVINSLTPPTAVPAGDSANYVLSVSTPGQFNQPVSLSCTAPKTISCSISPSSVMPTTTATGSALLTLSTALRTSVPPSTGIKIDPRSLMGQFGGTWLLWLVAVLALCTMAALRRRPMTAAFGFAVVLLIASVACSGGNTPGVPGGTPAGNYQITVTGVSGSQTSSTTLTLQVK